MIEYNVIVYDNGDKHWYLNGELHCEHGPAIECASGDKFWYLKGKCHREDGPAVEHASGDKFWYLNGERLTESEWQAKTSKPSHEDLEVEIDGVKYVLKRKS